MLLRVGELDDRHSRCRDWDTVTFGPSWKRSASALAVAVCVLFAVIGYGLARADRAAAAAPQPVLISASAANVDDERPEHHVEHAGSPRLHSALHVAVLHRTRPSTWSPAAQWNWWTASLASWATDSLLGAAGSCAPVMSLCGRERLTQFCIARH